MTAESGRPGPDAATGADAPTREEDERYNPRILIEGGTFRMGSADDDRDADDDERPQRPVTVSSFWIQEHQVTNEEYQRFNPSHPLEVGRDRHPVREINWQAAMDYAQWLGGSLPTEAQWEFAARGTEGRKYPWGSDEPTPERANYSGTGFGDTTPAAAFSKGATPEGVHDLAGNVWEWCSDWYGPYSGDEQVDPGGPTDGPARVLRGGSYYFAPGALRGADRSSDSPRSRQDNFGFRVAWVGSGGPDEAGE